MRLRGTNSKDAAMIHRSSKLVIALLALALALFGAVPASAYGPVNKYDLRLTLLDPLACGKSMQLQALLTQHGTPVADVTVYFTIAKGAGDTVVPASDVTDGDGIAITFVTIACGSQPPHQVLASVANNASARITLCGAAQSCLRDTRKVSGPTALTAYERYEAGQIFQVSSGRLLISIRPSLLSLDGF